MTPERIRRLLAAHYALAAFLVGVVLGQWNGARTGDGFGLGSAILLLVAVAFVVAAWMIGRLGRTAARDERPPGAGDD